MNSPTPSAELTAPSGAACVWEDLQKIRRASPLIHNITNYVVMNLTANALLAIGASPVMAHAVEEVEEMVGLAQALVINIGTLSTPWIEAMNKAAVAAGRRGIPIILDPVGSGATRFRTETAHRLLELTRPTVVRGNASEIRSLAKEKERTKGVDSLVGPEAAVEAARSISGKYGCAVSISGPVDLIVSGRAMMTVHNGHAMMPKITGLGCTASAITAAFCAVNPSPLKAAAHAMALMGVVGELAAEGCHGPGTFVPCFLDLLYSVDASALESRLRLKESADS